MKSQIELAREIATKAHEGQFRSDGVTPYITHPEAVASRVSDEAKPVAWLHDVMEDNPSWTVFMLTESGIKNSIANSVWFLTKIAGQNYYDYIIYLMKYAIAREVKIADIEHNLSCNPNPRSITKYKLALLWLKSDIVP